MPFAAHRIALQPTKEQEMYFRKACGVARFAYNWGLAEWKRMHAAGEKTSWLEVKKRLTAVKAAEFPWMSEVTCMAAHRAIKNLGFAFSRFFKWQKSRTGIKCGFPQFKKKAAGRDSFFAAGTDSNRVNSGVPIDGFRVKLAKIGWVKMRQVFRFSGRITRATVSRAADRWFVSLLVDTSDIQPVPAKAKRAAVGVDLGVKTLATTFDGLSYGETEGPKPGERFLAQVRRLRRSLSRKVKGSSNREKARIKLARLHAHIANVRGDAVHKLTARLAKGYRKVVIEDLNVRGMLKNRHLARAIGDMGFGEFRRQLAYKCDWYGTELIVADRYFPSSKTCPDCRNVNGALSPTVRFWVCPACNAWHDRDRAAAENLYGLSKGHAAGHAVSACGAEGAGPGRRTRAKPAAVKQEAQ